jgi:hypothetical protein
MTTASGLAAAPATAPDPRSLLAIDSFDGENSVLIRADDRRATRGMLVSFVLHLLLLLIFGLYVVRSIATGPGDDGLGLELGFSPAPAAGEVELELAVAPSDANSALETTASAVEAPADAAALIAASPARSNPQPSGPTDLRDLGFARHGLRLAGAVGRPRGGGVGNRDPARRAELLASEGGTPETEAAVRRALNWLAAHQFSDGGWRFNHLEGDCQYCRHPGSNTSTTGATGLALLCFLGAGETHLHGEHKQTVARGLYYLRARALRTPHGADLQEGTMYAQGIATLALVEAWAMTRDPALEPDAQAAVDFIVAAQDRTGGGWRYYPGQSGDTTVTAWQLMALRSAELGYLSAPRDTWRRAEKFLDAMAHDGGAFYGYQKPARDDINTAAGLLCRMYQGWPREHEALNRGLAHFAARGPSYDDLYFNYYATQVLHHAGGPAWPVWNRKQTGLLLAAQEHQGHESGSFTIPDKYRRQGGRLYVTCLATLTLEVYYRHLRLYDDAAPHDL